VETLATGIRPPLTVPEALERVAQARARAAILVEGWSDEAAVEAAARGRGLALADAGIVVLPLGGITNLGKFAAALAAHDPGLRLAGLYDASEEVVALRALQRAGFPAMATRDAAARAGFFACDADLEDELIRAVGAAAVERLLWAEDALASFRRFQRMPEHRERALHAQLNRFMGTRAGRKARFGFLMAAALAPDRIPAPLRHVLARAAA
jgi:hypothetical protein